MAYTTINKSTANFNTLLYTATGTQSVTGAGFQPDMAWVKPRSSAGSHYIADAVRGATKTISPNSTSAEGTQNLFTSFDSDGVSLGSDNWSDNRTAVIWNWKAGGTGSSNSDATGSYPITSTVSANQTAGFSIVKYTGNGYSTATIGHGLGAKPACVIMRPLGYSGAWWIAHQNLIADNVLEFNTNAQANISSFSGGGLKYSTFTTSVIGGGNGSSNSGLWNGSGQNYIAYCFAEKTGYSRFGEYYGNGSTDGTFVYTGFKPVWVMIKNKTSGSYKSWSIFDTTRQTSNPNVNKTLYANRNEPEGRRGDGSTSSTIPAIDMLSNGFKCRVLNDEVNTTNGYIYMAFGQSLVGSNNIPATAR